MRELLSNNMGNTLSILYDELGVNLHLRRKEEK